MTKLKSKKQASELLAANNNNASCDFEVTNDIDIRSKDKELSGGCVDYGLHEDIVKTSPEDCIALGTGPRKCVEELPSKRGIKFSRLGLKLPRKDIEQQRKFNL